LDNAILELHDIRKYFPGIKALDGVNLSVRAGEVHALIGENGAGKSTLVKVLTGIYSADSGQIMLNGADVSFRSPLESQAAGIAAIHQEATMFGELTVTENIFMGHHLRRGPFVDWRRMKSATAELLARLELDIDPDAVVRSLSIAQRHLVEIVKALSFDARIVIMDEPTSALSLREVEELYAIIRRLKQEGKAVIFISHKFDEIFEIADCFTVLRDGKYIGEGRIEDASTDSIIGMMVGRTLDHMYPDYTRTQGAPILTATGLSRAGVFKDVSFDLHEGEILGFFGLVGAGRSEIMRAMFGIDRLDAGTIAVRGKPVQIGEPSDAMKMGIAFVPEDRQQQGVILKMKIRENETVPLLKLLRKGLFLDRKREAEIADRYATMLEVRATSWEQPVESLSGGNQQKVVLAKWLATEPEMLILDEPTKGIDVATKAAVHDFVGRMAAQGKGIILVSSELPEVLGMSDNIIVLHEGEVTGRFTRAQASPENVMRAALGALPAEGESA